ncbi:MULTISPECIES: Yae1 family protein [Gordonibacter]|uniref:Yae1 family protein n=1 Tax=Gordonibacter faecis TaxID=3047475 RepID=A0ABT7DLG3_9ACTN|nr:Yae1 family protein [Gordonibacter sp. KGMB12511]MDJ1650366.1 Yae1 family protein [Gordonibacter sp. KGMB12511]
MMRCENGYVRVFAVAVVVALGLGACWTLAGCSGVSGVSEADVQAAREQGYREGFDAGRDEGYQAGFDEGTVSGMQKAQDEAAAAAAPEQPAVAEVIDTPYYSIAIPAAWEGTYYYEYTEGFGNQTTVAGDRGELVEVRNKADDKLLFSVACGRNGYDGIGNGLIEEEIGRSTVEPGYAILIGRSISNNYGDEIKGYGSVPRSARTAMRNT